MRSKNPSYARILKAGSSCVLYFASKSSVTYSESDGTWINGLSRRSHRVESCANPSLALMWNAPLLPPLNVLFVVHETVLLPPMCRVNQPLGREPGDIESKFS